MRKHLLVFVLAIVCVACTNENSIAKINSPAPDYTFKDILNSEQTNMSLKDLKGKAVILEFWATWCGPCIPAMKKLDSLQTEFKDDLEVIAISSENKERLEKFIKTTKSNLKLVSDTIHQTYFKYKIIPHSILIDKEGIVKAIVNPKQLNKEVIQDLISGNELVLETKDDFYIDPNLKVTDLKTISNQNYRIELKGYDQTKRGGYKVLENAEGAVNGMEMWNSTIPRMYQNLFDITSPNRMVFKDSLSYDDFPYQKEHQYNMTIEVSDNFQDEWRDLGIAFLNEQFDVNARIAIDTLDCYVLKNIDNTIKTSTATDPEYMFMGTTLKTKKQPITTLAEYLENFTSIPVVDKTNLKDFYDITLEWQAEDSKTLHSELKKYGLKLERSDVKQPVQVMEIFKKK